MRSWHVTLIVTDLIISQRRTAAKPFRNKPFPHFNIIDSMTPRKSKGGFIYRPDNDKAPSAGSGTPTMSSPSPSTSAPASDALNLIQLTTATNEIDTIMRPATPILSASTTNPTVMSPDIPSTFLAGSTTTSVVTSVSRTKRKHAGSDLSPAVSGGSAAKRSQPPSAATKAQQEASDAITEFNGIFAGFVDKFNETQTSANPEYACAIKLLRGQDGVGLSAQERMDISSFLGRNPRDVTLYVNSDAEVRALWLQQTLSKLNAANESGR